MHLACAAGVPTLGLFTRDNLTRYRPRGQHDEALCVAGLTPAEVAAAAAPFLHALQRLGGPHRLQSAGPILI